MCVVCVCVRAWWHMFQLFKCWYGEYFQSNVIEAAPNMQRESEKEWYYGNADKERLGPYSFEEVILSEVFRIIICDYFVLGVRSC